MVITMAAADARVVIYCALLERLLLLVWCVPLPSSCVRAASTFALAQLLRCSLNVEPVYFIGEACGLAKVY